MIPTSFAYLRAASLKGALDALAREGDDAKLLAGGQSLLPLMKLRLANPRLVVDIGGLADLSYVRDSGDHLAIGALTRYRALQVHPLVTKHLPVLVHVIGHVGDPQVRHRGTIGGALAHGDPAADIPALALALDGTYVIEGPRGTRHVAASAFHHGFLDTELASDEVLAEIRLPKLENARFSFQKFSRRAADWAIVGVVAVRVEATTLSLVNMGPVPLRARGVEARIARGDDARSAAAGAADGCEPPSDANASSAFRAHLAEVLVRRALEAVGF